MKDYYAIPDCILSAYSKCDLTAGKRITNFPKKKFANALEELRSIEVAAKWFDDISNDLGLEITPSALYTLAVSKGLTSYTPSKCPVCGKLISIKMAKLGVKYCSSACSAKSVDRQQKYKSTMQERYGVDAPAQSKEIKAKMNATLKERYGIESSAFESKEIQNKAKTTLHEKYGVDCSFKSPVVRDKIKQTNLSKFGYESNLASPKVKEQIRLTVQAKYGVEHVSQLDSVKEKKKAAAQASYGVDYSLQSKEVRDKIESANLKKYGVKIAIQSKEVLEKRKQTNIEKYGVDHPAKTAKVKEKIKNTIKEQYGVNALISYPEFKEKAKSTMLDRYGVEYSAQSKEIFSKMKSTMVERYGVERPAQNKSIFENSQKTRREHFYSTLINQLKSHNISSNTSKEAYITTGKVQCTCNICGYKWQASLARFAVYCPKCAEQHCISNAEKELLQFIKSIYSGKIIENTRKIIPPKELDIYLPEKRLAFEFNGTYWHSEKSGTPKNYHQEKTKACYNAKIRLIHIFEHEWMHNRAKIESLIRSALGLYSNKLYARKCKVSVITSSEYKQFLLENHLQSAVNSSIRYGLFYDNELVSVIGFGKSRFKRNEVELHRYCVKAGYQIIGGFSKLIKHACKESCISEFISYVDFSHFNGRGYKKIGFTLEYLTQPSYTYIKGVETKSRLQCQKHKLSAFLKAYDANLSESDNMSLNGWHKVYDCGNLKLKYTL